MPVRIQHEQLSNSVYFITFTCYKWKHLFRITKAYDAVYKWFDSLYEKKISVFSYVIMPNHIHAILRIMNDGSQRIHPGTWKQDNLRRDGQLPIPTKITFETLSNIIGAFKTTAATRVNKLRGVIGVPVWQTSFYDRMYETKTNWNI